MLETYRGIVHPNELDHMGHMNVQYYDGKFSDATFHLFAKIGMTNTYFQQKNRGMAAVQQNITYKAEAMVGDLLVCKTHILEVKDKIMRYAHHMFNSETGQLIAISEITGAHLDREIRKSCPFPDDIKALATASINTDAPTL